jgi:putative transposase
MKKRKYDTAVVMLYLLGKEKLLPLSFRRQIPYSTVSDWRKVDYSTYMGHEFRFLFEENWNSVWLKEQLVRRKRQLLAIGKVWQLFKHERQLLIEKGQKDKLLQNKLMAAVELLSEVFSLPFALRLLGVRASQYREWKIRSQLTCQSSERSLCLRRFPNQLCKEEVARIKSLLSSKHFQHWPVVSIAAYAQRKGFPVVSLYSWYKYARILQLRHTTTRTRKQMKGLIATAPNEYWHADTTYYQMSGTQKVCITVVMDNYSKMVLGFSVSARLSFDLIREALTEALQTASKQKRSRDSYLVTDGGRENNNHQVHQFLSSLTTHKLNKLTALKDIQFSNSPIEAIHRILKGRYLRNRRFGSLVELSEFLKEAIHDYNVKRPHYRHGLRTPKEAYFDIPLSFDPKEKMQKRIKERVETNKQTTCTTCCFMNAYRFASAQKIPSPR